MICIISIIDNCNRQFCVTFFIKDDFILLYFFMFDSKLFYAAIDITFGD